MMGMLPTIVVRTGTSLEREPSKLRFTLEPERSVDDELSDVVKMLVDRQYVTRVWVLGDRSGEDIRREFCWEVREGRH